MRRAALAAVAVLALAGCAQGAQEPAPRPGPSPSHRAGQSASASMTPSASPTPRRLHLHRAGFRLPVGFGREAVINTGRSLIVAGGLSSGNTTIATAYRVDLHGGTVTAMPSLPVAVHDTAGGLVNGMPIVIGGGNASEQSVVQGWNGKRWQVIGHLPQPRSDLVAAGVAGRVLVLGGYNGTRAAEPTILSTTDGRRWKLIGRLPVPVRYPASTVSGGAIWLFGGEVGQTMQRAIQRIDPKTGKGKVVGELPARIGHAVAIPVEGRILIIGGRTDDDTPTDRMWWFDPKTSSVRAAGRLARPLADSAVAGSGQQSYLIGGETPAMTRKIITISYH